MKKIPILLIGSRFILSFIIPSIGYFNPQSSRLLLVVLILIGLLTDVFDGIVARKLNISTEKLRKMDSNVDIVFAIGVLLTAFIMSKEMLNYLLYLYLVVGLELFTYIGFWLKFREQPSNHSYLTKCFGLLLFVNMCIVIGWGNFILFPILLLIAILSYVDGFAILMRLKTYEIDNKSVFHVKG